MKPFARVTIAFGLLFATTYAAAQPPILEFCPGTVTGVSDQGVFRDLECSDRGQLILTSPATYQLDKNGNLIPK